MEKYKFRWSATTIIVTALFILAVMLMLVFTYPYDKWWIICINLVVVVITLYFVAISPRYWVVTNDGLRLTRFFSPDLFFPFEEYSIESTTKPQMSNSIRVCGSGGFMGFVGLFYSKKLGFFSSYITDEKGDLLALSRKSDGKTVVMNGSYQIVCDKSGRSDLTT